MSVYLDNPIIEQLPLRKYKYDDYINQVKDNAILINKVTKIASVDPDYKYRLKHLMLSPEYCEDEEITWDDILEILKLEVQYWNNNNSKIYTFLEKFAGMLNEELARNVLEEVKQSRNANANKTLDVEDMIKKVEVS